ncbi:DUF4377 domain-containing protein [Pokkaliibacter sp. CJK22405]|uniref:DUF4377 domain-containing protein n=1 Tax=Pokkaliibacter sp. CJK22405 TaxID=3384615 RepID=UPI003984AD3B
MFQPTTSLKLLATALMVAALSGCMENIKMPSISMDSFGFGGNSAEDASQEEAATESASKARKGAEQEYIDADPYSEKDMVVYVSNRPRPCDKGIYGLCLEVKQEPGDDWRLLPDPIQGFNYQAGYYYTLEVHRAPKVGASAGQHPVMIWTLKNIIDKTPAVRLKDGSSPI